MKSPTIAPPNSIAYGKTLAQWQELYWQWAYGQVAIAPDNSYADGSADPLIDLIVFRTLDLTLTLDAAAASAAGNGDLFMEDFTYNITVQNQPYQ